MLIDADALIEDLEAAKANNGMGGMVANALVRYVKRCSTVDAVPVQRWIPVTERLPEEQADVLLFFGGKYKNMAVGFWYGEKEMNAVYWCAYADDGFCADCDWKPTHWMPLPEPPKEGE